MDDTPLISELSGLRHEYDAHGLRRADLHSDPIEQFRAWFAAALAAEMRDPNAMSLATASPEGKPSVRIVLLKGVDERGFPRPPVHARDQGHAPPGRRRLLRQRLDTSSTAAYVPAGTQTS